MTFSFGCLHDSSPSASALLLLPLELPRDPAELKQTAEVVVTASGGFAEELANIPWSASISWAVKILP